MNATPRTVRFVAAVASVVITWSLLSAVFALAEPPVADAMLVQTETSVVVR